VGFGITDYYDKPHYRQNNNNLKLITMRKIKILMAIILSLFVMVILQSSEKESAEVTDSEYKEDVTQTDKPLEKEGGVRGYYYEGFNTIEGDNYVDIDLKRGYHISDLAIYMTIGNFQHYLSEMAGDYYVIPVDLNMGDKSPGRRYMFLFLKVGTKVKKYFKKFYIAYGDCSRTRYDGIPLFSLAEKTSEKFHPNFCNLNAGTSGEQLYLCGETTYHENESIRQLRIVFHADELYAKSYMLLSYKFLFEGRNMNEGNSSPIKIFLGWK
jgi:hypothetical protein